ncbi:MAG: flagellar filament capping protein FliD [Lachnospiraceae bacterium]|nr:flagellar filament capping protein FliD [Lachnospiraceae bacterium]
MASNKIRMSGMVSGMDTEALITALTSNHKTKVDKAKGEQKKLSWTQDAWKSMNSKIYGLYSGKLSAMRFSDSYNKKVTTSSSSALSVVAGGNAAEGTMTAKVKAVAKAGYITGAELKTTDGGKVTQDTKLTELGITAGSKISLTVAGEAKEIEVTEDMTMYGFTTELRNAGVNANFDVANKRLFISAKETGADKDFKFTDGTEALNKLGLTAKAGSNRIYGSDAELELNGATFKSSSNTFKINGSTYTVNEVTDENITLKTTTDTSGIYDTIKNFFKDYNETINAMAKAYNAESSSKYSMLTDEMKDVMSEKEVEEWEGKIKDSLLRKDESLNAIMSVMRDAMSSQIEIDGKKYTLADFGIDKQSYLTADANERYAYHIDGDKDDEVSAGKTDKLNALIAENPELVGKFFSELSNKLYQAMDKKMASTEYSSVYKVYNDKKMQTEYNSYTKKIADLEAKLTEAEDRYYKKFGQMESMLSKLNDSSSSISALFNM